jgi:hypothetical protein
MTKIAKNEEESIEDMHTLDIPDIKVFTDSSGIEGMIGAAAVLYRTRRLKTKIQYKHGPQ